VLVVNEQEKVEVRNIAVDRVVGNRVVVAQGLKTGERIVVEGSQKAPPGSLVKPVPFAAPAATNAASQSKSN
jgi:membrane fusion protein (multidrug efflux system)